MEIWLPDPSLPEPVSEVELETVMVLAPFIETMDEEDIQAAAPAEEDPDPFLIAAVNQSGSFFHPHPPVENERSSLASYPIPKRLTLRHVEGVGEGVSYGTDYSTLAILSSPEYREGHVLPMIDLRGHRFDNGMFAANIGVIGRYIPSAENTFCEMLGFNAYFDWREGFKMNYQQLGGAQGARKKMGVPREWICSHWTYAIYSDLRL